MTEQLNKKPRIEYIDLFRAFGIILMIMGHIGFGGYFDKWIHAFHMPLFFFVSGWFYKSKKDLKSQIIKKVRSLLVPYVCFEIIQWAVLMVFVPEYRPLQTLFYIFFENTYKIPIENGTFGISPIPGAMWFLTAIFFCEVIYMLLDKIFACNYKLHISIAILVCAGMLAPKFLPFRLPWALDASLVGMGFFHIARSVKGTKAERVLNLKVLPALGAAVIVSALIFVCPGVNMRTGKYGFYLPFLILALGAIISGWNLFRYVEKLLSHGKVLSIISDWLKGIGKDSIVYLCLNQAVILGVTKLLDMIGLNGIIAKIPVLILTMGVLFLFELLICKTKLKVIIGK